MRHSHFERNPGERLPRRRTGSVFPIFLISLVLVSATAAVLVRTTLAQRSLVRAEDQRIQADWLIHSAVARAAAKLDANSTYSGESWQLSAEKSGLSHSAAIEIVVSDRTITVEVLEDSAVFLSTRVVRRVGIVAVFVIFGVAIENIASGVFDVRIAISIAIRISVNGDERQLIVDFTVAIVVSSVTDLVCSGVAQR